MRYRHVVGREQLDLFVVSLYAVRCEHVRTEQPFLRERADPGGARRRHQHLRKRLPAALAGPEELRFGLALGEMSREGKAELARTTGRGRACTCKGHAERCRL